MIAPLYTVNAYYEFQIGKRGFKCAGWQIWKNGKTCFFIAEFDDDEKTARAVCRDLNLASRPKRRVEPAP